MNDSSSSPRPSMTRRRFLACTAGAATAAALASLPGFRAGSAFAAEQNDRIAKLLNGAIEFHVHPAPDGMTPRKVDMFEVLKDAKSANMRAVVLKDKSCGTGGFAVLANKHGNGAQGIGAITLDASVGGLNAAAVEIEAALGSKVIWMPTYSAQNDPTKKKTDRDKRFNSITIIDDSGKLRPETRDILEIAKAKDMVVCSGHVSRQEVFALVDGCREMGLKKYTVTHPLTRSVGTSMLTEDQVALARKGAIIEHTWLATMPKHGNRPPSDFTQAIRAVGVERCLMCSDFGQVHNPTPLEGYTLMLAGLIEQGFKDAELIRMTRTNPGWLLGL